MSYSYKLCIYSVIGKVSAQANDMARMLCHMFEKRRDSEHAWILKIGKIIEFV